MSRFSFQQQQMMVVPLPCCRSQGLNHPGLACGCCFQNLKSTLGGLVLTAVLELVIRSASVPHAHVLMITQQHDQQ